MIDVCEDLDGLDDLEDVGEDVLLAPLDVDGLDPVAVLGHHRLRLLLEGGQPLLHRALR